jgi:hypothetical protein
VSLRVYDIIGKELELLVDEKQSAGVYEFEFDSQNLSSGIYFYTLFIDDILIDTKKMILIK